VFAVFTGEDWAADGLGTLDPKVMAEDMGGPFAARQPAQRDRDPANRPDGIGRERGA
jgi:hypothetical protein